MGSRGSKSSSAGYSSFESLIKKREGFKNNITFGTGVDISNKVGNKISSLTSYKISDLGKATSNIKEAIVQVQQGSASKRISQLTDLGFKVVSSTKPGKNKTDIVLVHVRR